ncbi:N-lysine methyltransferase SMYD2 [Rhypophila decipiens]|uniref:N-lysine methyltransferase SMYD2 n=1 Tax=Rhypophila decipiens TaxID=261697 RepID=A0AAN7BDQ0_9PEZI|nr:N-lysine methyltransferase SMYD2 [Rhypophila decipiens]
MAPPDFTNRNLFPSFNALPAEQEGNGNPTVITTTPTTLIAQVKDDMTITKPTLILTDRDAVPFALVFEGYDREEGIKFLKSRNLKKGATVILRNGLARKVSPREDSKSGKASLRIPKGREHEVEVINGKMERVFEIVERFREAEDFSRQQQQQQEKDEEEKERARCDACGKVGGGEDGSSGLFKCTGCGVARYCSKECQVKGWTDGGHKADCKVIKGIITIWGR